MNCKSNALCAIALLLPFGAHATNGTLTMNAASEYEVADYADLKAVGTGSSRQISMLALRRQRIAAQASCPSESLQEPSTARGM